MESSTELGIICVRKKIMAFPMVRVVPRAE
jgi:hypothetical protein